MSTQIILSWQVNCLNSSFGPTQAQAALEAVELYKNPTTDPVLGQLFALSVADDVTGVSGFVATRTLTLNMAGAVGTAFPCHPVTATPPELPYPLSKTVPLSGDYSVRTGSTAVPTSTTQIPELNNGDTIQFLSQLGVYYTIASFGSSSVTLTTPYTGRPGTSKAFKLIQAPVKLVALYSSHRYDTDTVPTVPAEVAGSGARTIILGYRDSTGSDFTVETHLTGKRPVQVVLDGGSVDIAEITSMSIGATGNFLNNVGQITLCELSGPMPALNSNTTEIEYETVLTDQGQLLIKDGIAYLPPSYFALSQQRSNQAQGVPLDSQLAVLLAQFVAPETASPSGDVPLPTYLSGLFTNTLQLALAGVPVVPQPIAFA